MKKILLALLMGFCFLGAFGQVDPVVRSVRFEAQSEAQMNAIPSNKLQQGSVCYRSDTNSLWRYNGTTWAEMTGGGGLQSTDIDTFAELDAIVADKSLANLNDAQTWTGGQTFNTAPKVQTYLSLLEDGGTGSAAGYASLSAIAGNIFRFLPANETVGVRFDWPDLTAERTITLPDANLDLSGGLGISNLVEDTTPQLGGTLDLNTNSIQGDIYPSADNTYDLGLPASSFANAYTFNSFIRHPSTAATDDYDWRFRTSPTANNFEIGVEDAEGTGAYTTTYTLNGTGTPSAATDLIDKAYADANYGGGGSSPPFDDTTSLVQDSVDGTKEMRIDVGAVSTATTRTLTMPDADVDLGNLGPANMDLTANYTWSGTHTFTTQALFGLSGMRINNATNDYWTQGTVVGQSPGFVFQSYDEAVFNTQYALNFSGSPVNTYDLTPKSYVDGLDHTDDQTASEVTSTATGNVSATNVDAAIAELASEKINTTISGRTGTAINSAQLETEAQIASNGAIGTNELVICSDCSPAEVVATATIAMDGWKMYDDQTADAATITLSDCDPGETLTVYINRASAPTLAGTGLTFNQLPNTTAFASATQMMIIFEVAYDGTTIDYYYVER